MIQQLHPHSMQRLYAFAFVITMLTGSCSKNNEREASASNDSTTRQTIDDHSALLPVFAYTRRSTLEGQFNEQLSTSDSAYIDREGLISLSETLVVDGRNDLTVRGSDYAELKLVMFREHAPVLKLSNSQDITFINVDFSAQYTDQYLVEISNCVNITFERCTFMFPQEQSIVHRNTQNISFNDCIFGAFGSTAEEPTLEEQSVETSTGDAEQATEDYELQHDEYTESPEETTADEEAVLNVYPSDAWNHYMNTQAVPRQKENLEFFRSNKYFSVGRTDQMNYASYAVLEFGRDFFSEVDFSNETETWQEGSDVETYLPQDCEDREKVLSLTRTRRKLWYIHRKLSFEQEAGIDANDRWRDDHWYRNRSYYSFLFDDRNFTTMTRIWNAAKPFLSGEVTISRQEFNDALLFIDELLLHYSKVKATPFWQDRFDYLANSEVNLSVGDRFHEAGFPVHNNPCMREGYSGGNYITGYDWGNEAWLYGFWLRRHREGNMEEVKDILLWAKAQVLKRS